MLPPSVRVASRISNVLRGFPLPESFDLGQATPVVLPQIARLSANVAALQDAFDRTEPAMLDTAATSTRGPQVKIGDLGQAVPEFPAEAVPSETFNVSTLNQSYALFEKQAFQAVAVPVVPLGIHLHDNDVDMTVSGVASGGQLVFSLGKDDRDAVAATGNAVIGAKQIGPLSLIFGVSRCTYCANTILNEAPPVRPGAAPQPLASLWLLPVAVTSTIDGSPVSAVTVTGNAFRGLPLLPLRKLHPQPPAPMDSWHFFNSET